jgi:glyoxylase-like metal-dependent hydrolase (beta-lactamase superfamily II)
VSVAPSALGSQPVGAAERVFEDVVQLKLPVPFPLGFVSSYLAPGDRGWTVVDPGFDYPEAREVWELRAPEVGLDLDGGVEKIVVTHLHPDHIGLARWLHERSGAPVFMLEKEIENARVLWNPNRDNEEFFRFLLRHGMDEENARPTAGTNDLGVRIPDEIHALHPGDDLSVGEGRFRVVHTPGHSDHHFMLHDEERGVLVAGDHLLLKITPNVGAWPYTEPRPLERYMHSLEGLRDLEAGTVLPGHGPVFHDVAGRVDELLSHHEERLDEMHASFRGEPATAFGVSRRVFPEDLSPHQLRFALAETLAHLELLSDAGRAERLEDEVVRFRAV